MLILKLLAALAIALQCRAANILYVIPFTSKSHYIMLRNIGLELSKRGHSVTVITAFKEENPPNTYNEVVVPNTTIWEAMRGGRPNVFDTLDISAEVFHEKVLWGGGLAFTKIALSSKAMQDFLSAENKFDLVICEQFFQEAMYVLSHKYNAPLILITTYGNCMRHNILVRNPLQLATVIPEFVDVRNRLQFFGRLRTFYFTLYEYFWWSYWYLPQQEKLVSDYVGDLPKPVPKLWELQKNTSLILLNSHFSYETPAAYLPNIVEVAGVHIRKDSKTLPHDLQKILDESAEGVIYMNFGSNIKSSEMPKDKLNAFLNVFKKVSQTVLWKWEEDVLLNRSSNVHVRKWLPQNEILAHPKIKVFIAHGGLIGLQEAIYHGVPVIGVPIYCDQYNNIIQAEEDGYGKILHYHDITEANLEKILKEFLDSSYKEKAMEISRRFRDRPLSALDTAMFWIEYVLRHKGGAPFMRNPALNMSWFEYCMLDVYLFVAAVLFCGLFTVLRVCRFVKGLSRKGFGKNKVE